MEKESKTHYRKVFQSDHLGISDLEEFIEEKKSLVFTIKEVRQEKQAKVAGRKIDANIAYFNEKGVKPMVLNSVNSKVIKKFAGSPFIEDWKNILIELYIDYKVSFGTEQVGGVRIKKTKPVILKPKLTPEHKSWEAAKEAVKSGNATKETISQNWDITDENYDLLCG